jgi:uncharacterized membrane protein (DUF373 family)
MNVSTLWQRFENLVVKALMFMMAIVVLLATVELGYVLIKDIVTPPLLILEIDEILDIFGMFMLVLIGLELFETIQVYQEERIIRVEVVILVAILAVARKVIILDYKSLSSLTLLEMGAAILGLSVAYLVLKTGRFPFMRKQFETPKQENGLAEGARPAKPQGEV